MASGMPPTVVGVFEVQSGAEAALNELYLSGFRAKAIGHVALRAEEDVATGTAATDAGEEVVGGAVAGGALGGALGAAVALLIPGIGPVVAGGVLASALGGAAIGAAAGGVLGALTDLGEEEALYYENELRSGRIIVTVHADGRAAEARSILSQHGAYDVDARQPVR